MDKQDKQYRYLITFAKAKFVQSPSHSLHILHCINTGIIASD